MKADIVTAKKQRGCSYCGSIIAKGDKLVETVEWINPMQKFPDKKNICWTCLGSHVGVIPVLKALLKDLEALQRAEKEIM